MRMCFYYNSTLCYFWNRYVCVYWLFLPERSLAQDKSRERLSTRVSYFLRKGLHKHTHKLTIFNDNQCWKVATLITYLVELHWTSFKIYSILKIFIVCWIYVFCMLECSFHLSCDVIIAVCIILTTGMTGAISIQIFCVYYYHTWKE